MKKTLFPLLLLTLTMVGCTTGAGPVKPSEVVLNVVARHAATMGFAPHTFTAKVGDTVVVNLTNEDVAEDHDFTIKEFGFNLTAPAGKTTQASFVATKSGTFAVYCTYPGHRDSGMAGTIQVR